MRSMPGWVLSARRFAATGRRDFLTQAAEGCREARIQAFLLRDDVGGEGIVSPEVFLPLVENLQSAGQTAEATVIEILGGRLLALMSESPDSLGPDEGELAAKVCEHLVDLSRQQAFAECEARFSAALGTRAANRLNGPAAAAILQRAAAIYRQLRATDSGIYRPGAAMTLNNLGLALREEEKLPEARDAFDEAAHIFCDLARSEPQVYRPNLATTLSNLGALLCLQEAFSAACNALEEAVATYRQLAAGDAATYTSRLGITLNLHATALRGQQRHAEALRSLEDALQVYRNLERITPGTHSAELALTLSSMGTVLSAERRFAEACEALTEAKAIHEELAGGNGEQFRSARASTLSRLGKCLRDERQFEDASEVFQKAVSICRELTREDEGSSELAHALTEFAILLRDMRMFREAHDAIDEAIAIYRRIGAMHLDWHGERLANFTMALDARGTILRGEGKYVGACEALEEATSVYRRLADRQPDRWVEDLAITLNNLGNVLSQRGRFSEALGAFEEALQIQRSLAKNSPTRYRPNVALILMNMSNALFQDGKPRESIAGMVEAAGIYSELATTAPEVYRNPLVAALGNQAAASWKLGDEDSALAAAQESLRIAEASTEDSRAVFLTKGNAGNAYRLLLEYWRERGDHDRAFRYLAAMREGHVRALSDSPAEGVEVAGRALNEARESTGREMQILVAQQVPEASALLAVLRPDEPGRFICEKATSFDQAGSDLFKTILKVYDRDVRPAAEEFHSQVRKLGKNAWEALPESIRRALDPAAQHKVLISGDVYWNAFPWEALVFGTGEADWLGLHRALVRWGPLTGASLRTLRPAIFGQGARSAAIVCPWDAVTTRKLAGAKEEAEEVAEQLKSFQYEFVPDGHPVIGRAAKREMMESSIEQRPSILHYTGHGQILGAEEVLLLCADLSGSTRPAPFGRKELDDLGLRTGCPGRLLSNGPLVVLNSCFTGRSRDFGGQREDLVWALLEEGAQAVIGCGLPVFDKVGDFFGKHLYRFVSAESPGMAWEFAEVRAILEACYRRARSPLWPAWTLLHYHGNPFAQLPHAADTERPAERSEAAHDFLWLADALKLPRRAEAEALLAEISGRLEQ